MNLTSTGLSVDTQAEILATIEADERAEISDRLDLSTSSPLGQLNRLLARAFRKVQESAADLYNAIDPDSASGDALFRLGALTGTIREPATASRVTVVCNLDAGTYGIGLLIAYPSGRPADTFANIASVTSTGGATNVVFQATATGPIQATANTLQISAPVAGWNSIVSHPDATPGLAIETEAAFRARRNQEVTAPGSSSVDGIAADLTQNIPEIVTVAITENDTDATVNLVPPHAIEVVVYGPDPATSADDQAVAAQILASKAAGIGTYGTTSKTVYDSQGQAHVVKFTRPSNVTVNVALTVEVDATSYAGDAELEAAIRAAALAAYRPGLDSAWSQFVAWSMPVAGVLRVTSVALNGLGPFNAVSISTRQKAALGTVTITSVEAVP